MFVIDFLRSATLCSMVETAELPDFRQIEPWILNSNFYQCQISRKQVTTKFEHRIVCAWVLWSLLTLTSDLFIWKSTWRKRINQNYVTLLFWFMSQSEWHKQKMMCPIVLTYLVILTFDILICKVFDLQCLFSDCCIHQLSYGTHCVFVMWWYSGLPTYK